MDLIFNFAIHAFLDGVYLLLTIMVEGLYS